MSELEKFLEERTKIPIPGGDVAWVKLLAKELASGVNRGLWNRGLEIRRGDKSADTNLQTYIENRWQYYHFGPVLEPLQGHGYVERKRHDFVLTSAAFDLLDEVEPYNIFISYRRLDSSALALLVLARLKEHSLVPFCDMALDAGGNWHADLEERIKNCDYFIILLGKDTLSSPMTVKEIQWALHYGRTIIPLWHSGFELNHENREEIDQDVKDAIQQTNAIIVQDESASGYNTAIVELLNRFGITP